MRIIRFIDPHYHDLFNLTDEMAIHITTMDKKVTTHPCFYIDDYHFKIMGLEKEVYQIHDFARAMASNGCLYRPMVTRDEDVTDFYEVYQIPDRTNSDYGFLPFEQARTQIKCTDYEKVYQGMLSRAITLLEIQRDLNRLNRPFEDSMHALSIGDIVVLHRQKNVEAFYINPDGYPEIPTFIKGQ